jgi:hypothetical protein
VETLTLAFLIIIAIPIILYLCKLGYAFLIIGARIISNFIPMVAGIVLGVYISNSGYVIFGIVIIITSVLLGIKWAIYLEDNFWDQ